LIFFNGLIFNIANIAKQVCIFKSLTGIYPGERKITSHDLVKLVRV